MRFNFSAEFLKVEPPDTTFGDAWESLCYDLLANEFPGVSFQRVRAPDGGIDTYAKRRKHAYQCKASERGAAATADTGSTLGSLQAAIMNRTKLPWSKYTVASNADFTAAGIAQVEAALTKHRINRSVIEFLGPNHWHGLCLKHSKAIEDRFYYRVTLEELDVIRTLQQARYYESFISEARNKLRETPITLHITSNRILLEFKVPFSKDLSVENLLDVCKELYGVNLDWVNFADLSTSAGPSVSIALGDKLVPFETKIGDVVTGDEAHLEFWIKIIWKDEIKKDAISSDTVSNFLAYYSREVLRDSLEESDRRELTIRRCEEYLQNLMWSRTYARLVITRARA